MEIPYPWNVRLACQPSLTSWHVSLLELFSLCVEVWWVGGRCVGGVRKNNKAEAKLNPGIKRKPRCL